MGGVFGGGGRRPSPPPPPPPKPKAPFDPGKRSRAALRGRYGRRGTILTGGQGIMDEADIRRKTLLGGG
jgi:hypothetical protein